jgi:hypothetical protein
VCTLLPSLGCRIGENRALSNEVHGRSVFVQVSEYGSERLARVQFLRGLRVLGVHVNDEVRVRQRSATLSTIRNLRLLLENWWRTADTAPLPRTKAHSEQ